ncbi:MAG: NCS2 family permease [Emergencia sp.]|nr:NCS2 family permease [Emergencia sp.]
MKKLFKLEENHTTVRQEIRAGLTTFFAMAYIIFLNPVFLSSTGMNSGGVMVATCLSAAAGTLLCAFLSNKPFAMAPGMGMNAFFAYTLCGIYGYSWQQALALTFISGILFFLIAISPLRDKIINAVPANLKYAISAGVGLFIALIGLLDTGIVSLESGMPALGDLSSPTVLIALAGLAITAVLVVLNINGSLIIGMIITIVLSLVAGQTTMPDHFAEFPGAVADVAFKLDFSGLISGKAGLSGILSLIALIISLTMVDMFDTLGFLIGTSSRAGMTDEKGNMPGSGPILIADAAGSVMGALFGTSTVTCYAESVSGIAAGGKTGLTAVTTALCFLLAVVFSPLTGVMTSAVTAPALIIVGMYLLMEVKKVDFSRLDDAIPAFITIVAMPMTYSITTGIAAGFIFHLICKIAAGRRNELNLPVVALAVVFLLYFCL